ncbi:MAG: hypothetical protein ABIH23_08995 [bacterium]
MCVAAISSSPSCYRRLDLSHDRGGGWLGIAPGWYTDRLSAESHLTRDSSFTSNSFFCELEMKAIAFGFLLVPISSAIG